MAKNKEKFIGVLTTLMFSWGSDTPPEAIWIGNDLLDWYGNEVGIPLGEEFKELDRNDGSDEDPMNYDKVMSAIEEKW